MRPMYGQSRWKGRGTAPRLPIESLRCCGPASVTRPSASVCIPGGRVEVRVLPTLVFPVGDNVPRHAVETTLLPQGSAPPYQYPPVRTLARTGGYERESTGRLAEFGIGLTFHAGDAWQPPVL